MIGPPARNCGVGALPGTPPELLDTFEAAKTLAWTYYDDSNFSLLVDARNVEVQRAAFGDDPWPFGLAANRRNLEQFIGYSHDQRLMDGTAQNVSSVPRPPPLPSARSPR